MKTPLRSLLLIFILTSSVGAASTTDDWDVTQPLGKTREVHFTTNEGTWMSVDISPDSTWLVFDLLGHIYRVPAKGGEATCLTQNSGIAVNYHPRISPDGKQIVFVSDRWGQDNLWTMNADGTHLRIIHEEMNARFAEPVWTPDGNAIIATKRAKTPSGFYRTNDSLWRFPRTGGKGSPVVIFGPSNESAAALTGVWTGNDRAQWASPSPDGQYLYFHTSTFVGRDRHLMRLNMTSGHIGSVTPMKAQYHPSGGRAAYPDHLLEVAPEVSPDGRWLAFARKLPGGRTSYRGKELNGRTALWLRDLRTGDERIIMDPISNTLAELHPSWHTRVLPGYNWASNSESIVLSQGGKIRRLWIDTGKVETVPFQAKVHRTLSEQARGQQAIDDNHLPVRAIRWPATSPDGSKMVFEAVGKLWLQTMPDGAPKLLTQEMPDAFQMSPSWSSDGKWIAFATASDNEGGHIWKVSAGGGIAKRLTKVPGRYLYPAWREDNNTLLASQWPVALSYNAWHPDQWQLVRLNAGGGNPDPVTEPRLPASVSHGSAGEYWTQSGNKLLFASGYDEQPEVIAIIEGNDSRGIPSPDGRWLAVERNHDIYIVPMPTGTDIALVDVLKSGKRLSYEGGYFPAWQNNQILEFSSAAAHYAYNVESQALLRSDIILSVNRDTAKGTVALTDTRIITLEDRNVIEDGSVLIRDGRITCVGKCDLSLANEKISLKGKTLIPGWVDTHAHLNLNEWIDGIPASRNFKSAAYLAYGVTTVYDPASDAITPFTLAELISAGRVTGPRTFSAGTALLCGAWSSVQALDSFEEAVRQVNRSVNLGAISIKDYKQCTRLQRTWLAEAARRRNVSLTSEGSDFNYLLGLVMSGHAGWEHAIHVRPTYGDVGKFFGQAGAHYSGTLSANGDYPDGYVGEYWFSKDDLWLDKKAMHWNHWQNLASRRIYAEKPRNEYGFPIQSETGVDIAQNGGFNSIGAHGEQPGLDTHWEAWTYGTGLTPIEVLEAASYGGAHFLGLEHEIGSITVGKLADLVVLNSNPLDDIHNTTDIAYVIKGGHIYDAETLDEIWPDKKPYGPRPWKNDDATRSDVRSDDYWDQKR